MSNAFVIASLFMIDSEDTNPAAAWQFYPAGSAPPATPGYGGV